MERTESGRRRSERADPDGDRAVVLPASGVSLHARLAGPEDAPLAILLHGFPEGALGWRHQIAPLAAAGLRVLAPDQRGYGRSDKPRGTAAYRLDRLAEDVLALADALGRERFALVGHDWGGIVAWHVAARAPERVERLAVLNAPRLDTVLAHALANPSQLLRSAYVAFFQLPLLPERVLAAAGFAALRRSMVGTALPGAFDERALRAYREAWSQPGALGAMLAWYRALPLDRSNRPPARLSMPVRVLWGERDPFLSPGLADAALALCDRGELVRLPEATHWLQHEAPRRVNALLAEFLAPGERGPALPGR